MRYLSEGISNQFQTDREGRRVFYPYGSLGAGYVLQCPEQEQGLKKQNMVFCVLAIIIVSLTQYYAGLAAVLFFAVPIIYLFYFLWVRFVTKGLDTSDERLRVDKGNYRRKALSMRWRELIIISVSSFLFFLLGLYAVIQGDMFWEGVILALVFGVFVFLTAFMTLIKVRHNS